MKEVSIIILLLFVLLGCKTHCPEFPANLNYFPYYEGQELKFTNSKQNIRIFIVSYKEDSKAYSFAWNCKCDCSAESGFHTTESQDSLSIKAAFFRFSGEKYISSVDIGFRFQYSYMYGDDLRITLGIEKSVPYDELYKYLEDTIIIENENNQLVKKVVIVKGKGLVSYTTADGEEWELVE